MGSKQGNKGKLQKQGSEKLTEKKSSAHKSLEKAMHWRWVNGRYNLKS